MIPWNCSSSGINKHTALHHDCIYLELKFLPCSATWYVFEPSLSVASFHVDSDGTTDSPSLDKHLHKG